MALKADDFDFISNFSAFWSVLLGALLATMGGLVGGQLESVIENRRRERDAALFLAELLSTIRILIEYAADSKKVGDPYGQITLRFLRSARREIDIYERNRENIYVIRDGELRARIHTIMLRLAMPIDGVFDSTDALERISTQLKSPGLEAVHRDELERRIETIKANRDTGFGFIVETSAQVRDLVASLARASGRSAESLAFDRIVQRPGENP